MKNLLLPLSLALAAACGSLQASTLFTFTDSGSGIDISGNLTANDNGNGTFTAISGDGFFNGTPITLLNASSAFTFDNVLYPVGTPLLDGNGLLFSFANHELNIYGNSGAPYSTWTWNGSVYDLQDNNSVFTLTDPPSVPEPASAVFVLTGGLWLWMARKRRVERLRSSL